MSTSIATQSVQLKSDVRIDWVDYAKGISIFLVVLIHLFASITNNNQIDVRQYLAIIEGQAFYSGTMPVFFLLSGIFITRAIREPIRIYTLDKLRTLAYPYVLWSLITFIATMVAASFTNTSFTPADMLRILYEPVFQFWFLYSLFIVVMLYGILIHLKFTPVHFLMAATAMFIIYHVFDLSLYSKEVIPYTFLLTFFFAVGAVYSQQIQNLVARLNTSTVLIMCVVAWSIWLAVVLSGVITELSWLRTLVKVIGMIGILSFAVLLGRFHFITEVQRWGRLSLQIYCAHWLALVAYRIFLFRILRIDNGWLYFFGSVASGVYLPLFFNWFCNLIGFKFAFMLPKMGTKPRSSSQAEVIEATHA
ncbi:MAG: acyltransferase [Chitinophagaceae bacterium]|nr:acyltransferase [Anaerolineae bacterium]